MYLHQSPDIVLRKTFLVAQMLLAKSDGLAAGALIFAGDDTISVMSTEDDFQKALVGIRTAVIALDAEACGAYLFRASGMECWAETALGSAGCTAWIDRAPSGMLWARAVSRHPIHTPFDALLPPRPVTVAEQRKACTLLRTPKKMAALGVVMSEVRGLAVRDVVPANRVH